MPIHISPKGHLGSAKTRIDGALASLKACIDRDGELGFLQQQAEDIVSELTHAARSVRHALSAAEADAAIKRCEARERV